MRKNGETVRGDEEASRVPLRTAHSARFLQISLDATYQSKESLESPSSRGNNRGALGAKVDKGDVNCDSHCAVYPPSTASGTPVIHLASSLAKKTAGPAKSSTWPSPRKGCMLARASDWSPIYSNALAKTAVFVSGETVTKSEWNWVRTDDVGDSHPGQIALQWILCLA